MIVNHKASALKFIANRINGNLEKYPNRSGAKSILSTCNRHAMVFNSLATMAETRSPLETPESHFIRVSNQANALLKKWQSESDQLFEYYRTYWLAIQNEILSTTGLNKPSPFADEIRASLKAMPAEQRTDKILGFIKANESSTLGALYEAPAFLSGLSDSEKEAHFNIYFGQHAIDLLNERKNLDDTYGNSVVSFMRSYQNGLKGFTNAQKLRDIEKQKELADIAQSELLGALSTSI